MREFIVDLTGVATFDEFVEAFNRGFCHRCEGEWHGKSWDAFSDYLSWPAEDHFRLTFKGWSTCQGLRGDNRKMVREVLADNPHVEVVFR